MDNYENEIRERLTANANDFDSIVANMLMHIGGQANLITQLRQQLAEQPKQEVAKSTNHKKLLMSIKDAMIISMGGMPMQTDWTHIIEAIDAAISKDK